MIRSPERTLFAVDVVRLIQLLQGEIWQVNRQEYGTIIRASINDPKVYFRVIVPAASAKRHTEIPTGGRVATHVVQNLGVLRNWLAALAGKEEANV